MAHSRVLWEKLTLVYDIHSKFYRNHIGLNMHVIHKYTYFSLQMYVQSKNGAFSCVLEKLTLVFDTNSKCNRNYRPINIH